MKDVQYYELFRGIALKNHAFSFFFSSAFWLLDVRCTFSTLTMLLRKRYVLCDETEK